MADKFDRIGIYLPMLQTYRNKKYGIHDDLLIKLKD